jgi:hypothetical protein
MDSRLNVFRKQKFYIIFEMRWFYPENKKKERYMKK